MASTSTDNIQRSEPKQAQPHPLPSQYFYSVEYPGYVAATSVPIAIRHLGGQTSVDNVFRRVKRNEARDNLVDLNFRPDNPFSHPVPGDITNTNKLLLKVVKRKRRGRFAPEEATECEGEYTTEVIGSIPKTLRFRSMADFQYQPDSSDPIVKLRAAMERLDAQAIKDFKFGPELEDYSVPDDLGPVVDPTLLHDGEDVNMRDIRYRSNLRLIPPSIFSRQGIPQMYNFKQNPMALIETTVDERTGEERKKYVNKSKWKNWYAIPVSFAEKEVPTKPYKQVEDMRSSASTFLTTRLQKLFEERPIWTRVALLNQFSYLEARDISNTKYLIPLFCYVFHDGPWRDTLVRFGYDPRIDISSRFYQRIYFRNVNNHMTRPSVTARVDAKYPEKISVRNDIEMGSDNRSHIFDGETRSTETASFQLCDIHDPMLKAMIETEDELRDECDDRDGWYNANHIESIKTVLRHKFFSLLEGHIPTQVECESLLAENPQVRGSYGPTYTRKPRKHNKAKGALPPEEAAAVRLRKTLAQEKAADM